ncbi:uncharacterized protein VTP21DRAFT_8021 [Calcarisporiella thermophila]|uniref:uncharacterized protein n=1 Tax=Calcarisporiella thermophila TaxID=911321 RepID=UPI0037433553
MTKQCVHILVVPPPAFGHIIPAISLIKRILNTPSLEDIKDVNAGSERLVTLLVAKNFLPLLKEKKLIPSSDDSGSEILQGHYGRMRIEVLEDDIEPIYSQKLELEFFARLRTYIENVGLYLNSLKANANSARIPISHIVIDMLFAMFESFPFAEFPYYFFFTSPAVMTGEDPDKLVLKGPGDDTVNAAAANFFKEGLIRLHTRAMTSKGVIWNTARCIEGDYLENYLSLFQHKLLLYPVGPLNLSDIDPGIESNKNGKVESHPLDLDQRDNIRDDEVPKDLESWIYRYLDGKSNQSVLYVSFGTVVYHEPEQITELLNGFNSTGRHILWSLSKKQHASLPVAEMTSPMKGVLVYNKVTVVEWAPQRAVLSHPSCAAFLTHCGWNSSLESLTYGVGTIHWPVFADQPAIAKLLVKLGTGVSFELKLDSGSADPAGTEVVPADTVFSTIEKFFGATESGENKYTKRARELSAELKMAWTPKGEAYHELGLMLSRMHQH